MTAIRGARSAEGRFVQLTNACGQDERLSLEARGIVYLVLSLPPDFRFTRKWLVERVAGRNGRRCVDKALTELEQYGYFVREKTPTGQGKWDWDQTISDDPAALTDYRNRSSVTTCDDATFPQVVTDDRFPQDDNRSTKRETRPEPNTVNTARRPPADRAGDGAPPGAQTPRRYARAKVGA